jgi:hypothetical protein
VRFPTGPAERTADADEALKVRHVSGVVLRPCRQVQEFGQVGQRGDTAVLRGEERPGADAEPHGALAPVVAYAEHVNASRGFVIRVS